MYRRLTCRCRTIMRRLHYKTGFRDSWRLSIAELIRNINNWDTSTLYVQFGIHLSYYANAAVMACNLPVGWRRIILFVWNHSSVMNLRFSSEICYSSRGWCSDISRVDIHNLHTSDKTRLNAIYLLTYSSILNSFLCKFFYWRRRILFWLKAAHSWVRSIRNVMKKSDFIFSFLSLRTMRVELVHG